MSCISLTLYSSSTWIDALVICIIVAILLDIWLYFYKAHCSPPFSFPSCFLFFFFFFFFSVVVCFGWGLWHGGSQFPSQGLNPFPMHWEHRVLTTAQPRRTSFSCFYLFGQDNEPGKYQSQSITHICKCLYYNCSSLRSSYPYFFF